MQLTDQDKKVINELNDNFNELPQEKRIEFIKEITKIVASMDQDVKGMVGILQKAKDNKDIEALKLKMQGGNS